MPIYHKLGKIPPKRHTQFRKEKGFILPWAIVWHHWFRWYVYPDVQLNRPTMVKGNYFRKSVIPEIAIPKNITMIIAWLRNKTWSRLSRKPHPIIRQPWHPHRIGSTQRILRKNFFKMLMLMKSFFIHKGSGTLRTLLGNIDFEYGDYTHHSPRIIYQINLRPLSNRILFAESFHPIYTPKKISELVWTIIWACSFCERDYKLPGDLETHDEKGEFIMKIKKQGILYELVYPTHPFDLIGWDGSNYPYGFSIHNFEPITGRVHQPPPVHQTFETKTFVVCSFCPRVVRLSSIEYSGTL